MRDQQNFDLYDFSIYVLREFQAYKNDFPQNIQISTQGAHRMLRNFAKKCAHLFKFKIVEKMIIEIIRTTQRVKILNS